MQDDLDMRYRDEQGHGEEHVQSYLILTSDKSRQMVYRENTEVNKQYRAADKQIYQEDGQLEIEKFS